jgi:N-acetyl-gamma-glutamyl-phosphate reductase
MSVKVGILGATGYTGAELVRILSQHDQVEIVFLGTQNYGGQAIWEVYPHLFKYNGLTCAEFSPEKLPEDIEVLFIALPHGHAMPIAASALGQGKKVIDLGADFRLTDYQVYQKWYDVEHTARELLPEAVYGLPELKREQIKGAKLVANPGCYPTSVILALAPLLHNSLAEFNTIVIDSKSGVSGAGRGLALGVHFSEANENFKAYGVGSHRHTPEIEQELSQIAGSGLTVSFTPHLLPITRGILSTIYTKLTKEMVTTELIALYQEFYQNEFFVRVLPEGVFPQTKWTTSSNHCDLGLVVDQRTGRVVIMSAIDNLVKGAAGQAIQNMNLICGFPENKALAIPGLVP